MTECSILAKLFLQGEWQLSAFGQFQPSVIIIYYFKVFISSLNIVMSAQYVTVYSPLLGRAIK